MRYFSSKKGGGERKKFVGKKKGEKRQLCGCNREGGIFFLELKDLSPKYPLREKKRESRIKDKEGGFLRGER